MFLSKNSYRSQLSIRVLLIYNLTKSYKLIKDQKLIKSDYRYSLKVRVLNTSSGLNLRIFVACHSPHSWLILKDKFQMLDLDQKWDDHWGVQFSLIYEQSFIKSFESSVHKVFRAPTEWLYHQD